MKYDYLIVGAGFYGSVIAHELHKKNKKVLVVDKRDHIGGNAYTKKIEGIDVHMYGIHLFHTNNKHVWDYVSQFTDFYNCTPRIKVNYKNKIYSFPINLMTLHQVYGVVTPEEAQIKLASLVKECPKPANLEEWIVSQVGQELYEIFVKGYTTKQWGKPPHELPASIIKRLPIRLFYDDTYHHNAKYQGIPVDGYTPIFEKMLEGIDVKLNYDFLSVKNNWTDIADYLVYSGPIDAFFDHCYGRLEYRGLRHESKVLDGSYQGCAQINFTDEEVPYTRIIEHKFIQPYNTSDKTVVTWEYATDVSEGIEPFYPVTIEVNNQIYDKYVELSKTLTNVKIGGRLGKYVYIDMDQTIAMALNDVEKL